MIYNRALLKGLCLERGRDKTVALRYCIRGLAPHPQQSPFLQFTKYTLHSPSLCITLWFFFPFFVLNLCVPCLCPLLYPHVLSAILAPGGQQGLCPLSFLPAAGRLMNQRFHGGSSGVSEGAGMADRLHRTPSKQN